MVCNDLDEFTSTMQKDTKKVVDQTKQTLKVCTKLGLCYFEKEK